MDARNRVRLFMSVVVLVTILFSSFIFFRSNAIIINLSNSLYDYFVEKKVDLIQPNNDIVMISIDDSSIRSLDKIWPWPRVYHAGLINELNKMGAKIIAYDVLFTESSDNDSLLQSALDAHQFVVLPRPPYAIHGEITPFSGNAYFGHVSVNLDDDGVVRSFAPEINGNESFSLAILRALDDKNKGSLVANFEKGNDLSHAVRYVYNSKERHPIYSFSDVLMGKIDPSVFEDKIIFVGVTATGVGEKFRSSSLKDSISKSGVELQVTIFESLREGITIEKAGNFFVFSVAIFSVILVMVILLFTKPLTTIIVLTIYTMGLLGISFFLFYHNNYWYSPIAIIFSNSSIVFSFIVLKIHNSIRDANKTLNLSVADRTKKLVVSNMRLAQEMNEKEKIWRELRNNEEQLRVLLDGLQVGIVLLNESGELITANSTALLFFDLDELGDDVYLDCFFKLEVGQRAGESINTEKFLSKLKTEITEAQLECILVSRNEKYNNLPVSLLFSRVKISDDNISFACIIRDISDQKRAEFITQEFVATVTHELRTPITSIKGSLELINSGLAGEIPEKAGKLLELANRNSERLLSLVNDILDIQKLQLGTLSFNLQVVDLVNIVKQSIVVNISYAQNYSVEIVSYLPSYPIYVFGDSNRLIQIMSNLLSNAAKFSKPTSNIDVRVLLEGKRVKVEVQDYGVGIPAAFSKKIFGKFAQADDSKNRSKGTGLGLSISKVLVEQMKGQIWYESIEGKGSIFYFYLPIAPMEEVTKFIQSQKIKKDMFT